MKYVDEYRDAAAVHAVLDQIRATITRPWVLMEICGGQTHSILRHGIDQLLPPELELVHGPGCPVCVTPLELIDQALAIASRPEVIFCSFGDMLRVPGSEKDLFRVKAQGGDVRVLYSPLDALKIAQENPDREVVFFGVGFETTAPANAMAVAQARQIQIPNFSVLVSHVRVPPAIHVILSSPTNRVQGFLAAGHVCAVMGFWEYHPLAERFGAPIVVTGFEPLDVVQGILMAVQQLESGRAEVANAYGRAVTERATQGLKKSSPRCSRSATASGAESAGFPAAAGPCGQSSHLLMPRCALTLATSSSTSLLSAAPARYCKACSNRSSVPPLARNAPPGTPLAHRWSRPKGLARPTSPMGACKNRRNGKPSNE